MKCKKRGKEKHSSDFYYTTLGKKKKSPHCKDCRNRKLRQDKKEMFSCVGYNGVNADEIYC